MTTLIVGRDGASDPWTLIPNSQDTALIAQDPGMPDITGSASHDSVGLCALCLHARRITSARGSTFWLCRRSFTDKTFRKYPALPVLHCTGHEPEPRQGTQL
jgi:hypothetical protein